MTILFALGGTALAGAFEDGLAAYQRGDFATALEKYRHAGQQGDVRAQLNLGGMYDSGQGVKKNYREAIKWYRLAATQGSPDAQFNLDAMHYAGLGVKKNIDEAAKWFRKAAGQGDPEAAK